MKKNYLLPVATEECFIPNEYVAACQLDIHSEASAAKFQCANPSHSHFMNGNYIGAVFVEADNNVCTLIWDKDQMVQTTILDGNNAQPAEGATVYGEDGTKYTCNYTYNKPGGIQYYVPWQNMQSASDCYCTIVNLGALNTWAEKLLS